MAHPLKNIASLYERFRFAKALAMLSLVVFLGSCVKDIDIGLGSKGGTLTAYSFVQPDSLFRLSISKSVSILSTESYSYASGASFNLFINGSKYGNWNYPENTLWDEWPVIPIQSGDSLLIQFLINDEIVANANTYLPSVVPIQSIDTTRVWSPGDNGELAEYIKIDIVFADPPEDVDYYQLKLLRERLIDSGTQTSLVRDEIEFPKDDKIFISDEQGSSSIGNIDFKGLFTDASIQGENYKLSVMVPVLYFEADQDVQSQKNIITLYHLTDDYYKYVRSRIISETYENLPIFDPVKIHSNVIGGYGLIAGLSSDSDTLVVK